MPRITFGESASIHILEAFDLTIDEDDYITYENENRVTDINVDILSALKGEDSHGTAPLGWDVYGL
jgi:hypothetical protein